MRVKEIMTRDAEACDLNASLTEAAKMLWENDCGALPVLKDGKEVVGLITDRDICMAVAMRDQSPSAISVEEILTGVIYSVAPNDDVHKALEMMREHKVRRLPVVEADGELKGILSMNDVTLRAEDQAGEEAAELSFSDVMETYKAVCAHSIPNGEQSMTASV